MAKGTQYSKQFKEDAVRYRKDHPELTVQKSRSHREVFQYFTK